MDIFVGGPKQISPDFRRLRDISLEYTGRINRRPPLAMLIVRVQNPEEWATKAEVNYVEGRCKSPAVN